MATETLNININQRGGRQTTKTMVGLGAAMAAVGYAAVRAGKTFVKSADEMTRLRNQTKVFAKDQGDAAYRMQETVRIARDMNQSLNTVGQVMQRVSLAQESAGISTETTVKIVENLSKAVALSGATSQEAEGALRQFAQGLAANRLSGQELNSVLEQTPLVAAVLADSLNVAVGDLRRMGEQGELTTAVLVDTFGKEIPKLADMMAKFEFPLENLFISISREATIFVDKLGEVSGATGMFRRVVEGVLSKLNEWNDMMAAGGPKAQEFARGLQAIAAGLGAVAAIGGAALLISMLNPVTLLAGGVAALVAAFVYFKDETFSLNGVTTDFSAILAVLVNDFKLMAKWSLAAGQALLEGIGNRISPLIDAIKDIIISAHMMKAALSDPFGDWDMISLYADANKAVSGMGSVFDGFFSVDHFLEQVDGAFGGLAERAAAWRANNPLADPTGVTREAVVPMGAPAGEGKGATNPKMEGWTQDYERVLATLDPLVALQQEYAESLAAVDMAKKQGIITDQEYTTVTGLLADQTKRLMDEANFERFQDQEAMKAGAMKGFTEFFQGLGGEAQAWADGLSGAFNMASDALADFVTTGKFNFKNFARDMIAMIQKVILKLLLMKALEAASGAMGFSLPSGATSGGGIAGVLGGARATGGPVASGKPYMVGEKGPELFVPPSSGSIKNASATAGMAPRVNVSVVNVDDPNSVPNAMATDEGEEVILNVISRNSDVLRELG